jgi:hypothetical protein
MECEVRREKKQKLTEMGNRSRREKSNWSQREGGEKGEWIQKQVDGSCERSS